jgi:hypothetical protein
MKTALEHKNDEFLVMSLKHVLSVMGLVNHPRIPKLWAIAHKNGHKRKNDECLVMSLKHVHGPCKSPRTPKILAIALEKALKRKYDECLVMSLKMY